ncbi:MAG TPA: glycosyltransferase family 87 protein [Chloroflexota bacterium]|nr:glycosyltransferase family 87 protein [Chloroflexota bacterium]
MATLLQTWLSPWPDSVFLTDFVAFRTAASIVREGDGTLLYDMGTQREYQRLLRGQEATTESVRDAGGFIPFHNPPVLALLLVPLASLPFSWGHLLWLLGTVVAFVLSATLPLGRSRCGPLAAVALLTFPGVADTLLWGQMVGLLALSLGSGMVALRNGKPFLGGLLLGLLWLKPQYAVGFPLLFLLKRRWRELAGVAVSAAVIAVASVAVIGQKGTVSYLDLMRGIGAFTPPAGSCVSPEMMVNWRALLLAVWPGIPDLTGSALVSILGFSTLLISLGAFIGPWAPRSPRFGTQMLALTLATLLASPHSHFHGLALLLPPAALLLGDQLRAAAPSRFVAFAMAGIYLPVSALWWGSLLTSPGRAIFWIVTPFLVTMLIFLVAHSNPGTLAPVARERLREGLRFPSVGVRRP